MAVIEYSDNYYSYYAEGQAMANQARARTLADEAVDPYDRLARYTLARRGRQILNFARVRQIDLHDPEIREAVLIRVDQIKAEAKASELAANDATDWIG